MKNFKLILLLSMTFCLNANYAINDVTKIESLHAHDVKFSVFVKNGEQLLNQAVVKVFINKIEVATGTSNELGKVNLLVKSYKHEKATFVTTYENQTKTLNNVTLQNGKFYYADFAEADPVNTQQAKLKVEKEAAEKRKIADNTAKERIAKANAEKAKKQAEKERLEKAEEVADSKAAVAKKKAKAASKEAKAASKEAKIAKNLKKKKAKYEKKLGKIIKAQRKIDKSIGKLDKSQKKLDEKRAKVNEDAEFLKIKDRQLRIDSSRNKLAMKQKKLDAKLEKLNKKFKKYIN